MKRTRAVFLNHIFRQAGFLLLLPLLLVSGTPAFGQSYRGNLRGIARDASGGALLGAKVTARNTATGLERSAMTIEDGSYVIPELPAGEYDVIAEAKDLQPQTLKAIVDVGKDTPLDISFGKVATLGQQVTVTTATPLVDTTRDVLGQVVEHRLVQELPLNGRDFGKLVALVPGVTVDPSGVAGTQAGFGQFNINGNRDRSNNYTLDGTDNNDPWFNNSALNQVGITGTPATLLPLDAIQEFNLQSQFPAEYGRNSGSVVNLITKSGTNHLHGSLFEYHRNSFFDARNFFNTKPNPQSPFINNQFGASLGGPLVHDKTFFFGAYEGQRERVASDFVFLVPTDADRTTARMAAKTMNSAINTTPLDKILDFFPRSTTGFLNAFDRDKNDGDNFIIKLDHRISNVHSIAGRYAFGQNDQIFPLGGVGGSGSGSRLPAFAQRSPTRVQVVSLSWLSIFNAQHLNEVRFGYTRFRNRFGSLDDNINPADPAGINLNFGTGEKGLPEFDFGGIFDNLGATGFGIPRGRVAQNFQLLDNFTWIRGAHAWKFGGEARRAAVNAFNDNLGRGVIGFSGSSTVDILTNFYLGNACNFCVSGNSGNTQRTTYTNGVSFFAQDDFRFRPNLTLNYGLRWEYFGPISEKQNRLSNLVGNNLVSIGTGGISGVYARDLNNFGPRIGLAWNPFTRTVVRANYGVYYDYIPQHLVIANFTSTAGIATNPGGPVQVVPLGFNPNAFNGSMPGPVFTPNPNPPFTIFAVDRNLRTPYVQSWNLNIQEQVGSALAFEAGYVGSKGTKLVRLQDLNQNGNFPNTNFGSIFFFSASANSTYNALQLIGRLQNWHRLSGFSAYTFSKSLDGASDGIDFNFATVAFPQDSNNLRAEKGPSVFDTKHRFTTALNYQVPVCAHLPKRLAEGWQLNTVTTVQSGRPIGITTGGNNNFHQRPDLVPGQNPVLTNWTPQTGYLNPAAFAPASTPDGFGNLFGNLGRNRIYGPGFWNVDFSVTKNTKLTEVLALQFRTELFNIFNHPNFALPGNFISPGMGPMGQILATPDVQQGNPGLGGGGPRVLQFALKLVF